MSAWRTLPITGRLFESARWLEHERCFQWVDILTSRIYRWNPAANVLDSIDLGFDHLPLATPSAVPGVQLLASRDTVFTYRWGERPQPLTTLPVGPGARLNDGIVDPSGRLWIGSMGLTPDPSDPRGKLWRLDADGAVHEMLRELGISNGIAWANQADGFHVDSLARTLYSLSAEGGSLHRERLLEFSSPIEPDGILLADGVVWIALWDGRALARFDPSTGHCSEVPVPAARPSSLAMSPGLALITTAGRGTGSDLDASGQVIVQPTASFEAAAGVDQARGGLVRV